MIRAEAIVTCEILIIQSEKINRFRPITQFKYRLEK